MKQLCAKMLFGLFALMQSGAACAAGRGTADEAVAMVKKAIAYIKANGREKAFAEFNNLKGQFKDRDLYVFVVDFDGKALAHGANPIIVGRNVIELKDPDGKNFIRSYLDLAAKEGKGWIDYKWLYPENSVIGHKSTYIEKMGDIIVGCGIYK